MAKSITEHKVRAFAAQKSRYRITEDNLQLEVQPSGMKSWYCQGRADGKRFRKKLGEYPSMSVKEAREAVRKVLHERDEGLRIIDDPSTFEAFVEGPFRAWCESERRQGAETMKRIRYSHMPRFGDKKLRGITLRDVELHKAALLKKKAPATVKRELGDLKRIFSKAVEWKLLRESPAAGVSDPKVERAEKLYLTEDELDRLHKVLDLWEDRGMEEWRKKALPDGEEVGARRFSFNPEVPRVVRLIMSTGLRKSEALSLLWSDIRIDDDTPTLTVRSVVAKSGKSRTLPINRNLVDVLMPSMGMSDKEARAFHRAQVRKRGSKPIFHIKNIEKAWQRLRHEADLDHITLHTLRHHVASTLVLKGTALSVVMKVLGHSDLATTQVYLSVRRDDMIEALDLL